MPIMTVLSQNTLYIVSLVAVWLAGAAVGNTLSAYNPTSTVQIFSGWVVLRSYQYIYKWQRLKTEIPVVVTLGVNR
jgi:hypothetical protein